VWLAIIGLDGPSPSISSPGDGRPMRCGQWTPLKGVKGRSSLTASVGASAMRHGYTRPVIPDPGSPPEGWYADPTARHEQRWFSAGAPTQLVRDGKVESTDVVSAAERGLGATDGPGLSLPESSTVSSVQGPVAWWDTAVPEPGEPSIVDIGASGMAGYSLLRELRMAHRVRERFGAWSPAVLASLTVLTLLPIVALLLILFWAH
jgi:hypothetical protein